MGILAENTERKALYELAKALRFLDNLDLLMISNEDAFKIKEAENLLREVVGMNGFTASYSKFRGVQLKRTKKQK